MQRILITRDRVVRREAKLELLYSVLYVPIAQVAMTLGLWESAALTRARILLADAPLPHSRGSIRSL